MTQIFSYKRFIRRIKHFTLFKLCTTEFSDVEWLLLEMLSFAVLSAKGILLVHYTASYNTSLLVTSHMAFC